MITKESARIGRCIVETVEPVSNKFLHRSLSFLLNHSDWLGLAGGISLILLNYEINESTMSYSDLLIECKDLVDTDFHAKLNSIQNEHRLPDQFASVDSSGSFSHQRTQGSLPMQDILEGLSRPDLYKTLELGCCRTYSHHTLGTRCLTVALVYLGDRSDWVTFKQNIVSVFSR